MITVIAGTNRKNSRTRLFAEYVVSCMQELGAEKVELLALEDLPTGMLHADMYSEEGQSKAIGQLQDQFVIPAQKFYFVVPEYNGGIPGVLKSFIDACSIRKYKESFHGGKKAALLGVSSGRAGSLRGMDYMTGFLNYLQINVMPNRQPVSSIEEFITDDQLTNEGIKKLIKDHAKAFLDF
ncbi:MAG: NAD(P)H-dependent oxidoreductase [Aureispira sp.]|nr:NAD(P)H-dependent oxidoreductase [Aureispira sp.]